MYAFGPLPRQKRSGRVIGTHQKIDRIARQHLAAHIDRRLKFPSIDEILHFEGSRGPDGIKMKSPGKDEPWHFIDPSAITDEDELLVSIDDHRHNLTAALVAGDQTRAAFEAAWLAHAVADGLTPAHHDSYRKQVDELGAVKQVQTKLYGINLIAGNNRKEFMKNNWKYWGAKGLVTTHTLFEAGIATTAKPLRFKKAQLQFEDLERLQRTQFIDWYTQAVQDIAALGMYDEFKQKGWTRHLAQETTRVLLPTVITAVVLAWYEAYRAALKEKA